MKLFKKCLCAYPVVTPRRQPGGPSALTRLGRTNRKARRGKTKRKARLGKTGMGCRPEPFFVAPNEVRGASLSLGRTKKGARQDKERALGRTKKDARQDKNGGSAGRSG
jgi:hypothetical protein